MSLSLRSLRLPTLAVAGCLALMLAGASSASAASCNPPKYPGAGYFTGKIKTTKVSCSYARKFVVSYYRCRIRNGGADGRCRTRVNKFRCSEVRESIPTEIDARVTCRRGTQRIVHTYQQNLE